MTNLRVQRLSEQFWAMAGAQEAFPRNLESAILWTLPVAIIKVPRLRISHARGWLEQRNLPLVIDGADRELHACLIAFGGRGLVFLDGKNPPDEIRFSLAHEMGHFIIDYFEPRRIAVARFGSDIADVLDGRRPPTVEERGAAILSSTMIGVYRHLMARTPSGGIGCSRIAEAENTADELALELLAPAEVVKQCLAAELRSRNRSQAEITTILKETFGLPTSVAVRYSLRFDPAEKKDRSVKEWLGLY